MKLKIEGKLRDGFFGWLASKVITHNWIHDRIYFKYAPQSAQFGLLQEYADTLGIKVNIRNKDFQNWFYYEIVTIDIINTVTQKLMRNSRPESQVAAIEKLNEIVNKNL